MKNIVEEAQDSFRRLARSLVIRNPGYNPTLDFEINKKILTIFQVGDYYYYVFNLVSTEFDFMSPEVETILGYKPDSLTLSKFMSLIHPDDVSWFLNFENKVVEFFSALHPDQILKYKVRYDYRVKKANGEYVRILQQVITLQHDEESGSVLKSFGVHTDITHLKKEGNPSLSLIGMEGQPSYENVQVNKVFTPVRSVISEREKQVLHLLIAGKQSKAIASQLFISSETVNKHRRNMLRKANAASTPELVAMAMKKGWV